MIEGRASVVVVDATCDQVVAFVLDLDRYRQADRKIAKVRSVAGDDTHGEVVFTAKLRGLPTPADRQTYQVAPDRRSLEFRSVPSRWPGLLASIHGTVTCQPVEGGTVVTHIERFAFSPCSPGSPSRTCGRGSSATPHKRSPGSPNSWANAEGAATARIMNVVRRSPGDVARSGARPSSLRPLS